MSANFEKIRNKWQLVIYLTLVLGALTFFVSTLIPAKYRSDVTLLIIQHNVGTLSAARSAEYLGEIFSQVLYTESFLNDVLSSPIGIEKGFPTDAKKKKEVWKKQVDLKSVSGAGILEISVYDRSRQQAEKIAAGIAWNFANNGKKYHGGADNVEVKIIDGPVTTANPAYPNVFASTLTGLLVGLVGSLALIFFFDGFDIKLFEQKKNAADPEQKTGYSAVERQLQRQLKRRKEVAELKYALDEPAVYDFSKQTELKEKPNSFKQIGSIIKAREQEMKKEQKISDGHKLELGRSKSSQEKSQGTMKTKIPANAERNEKSEELSRELEEQKKVHPQHVPQKEVFEHEHADKKKKQKTEKESSDQLRQDQPQQAPKPNFIARLFGRSLFGDQKAEQVARAEHDLDQRKQQSIDQRDEEQEPVEHVRKINNVSEELDELPWMGGSRTAPAPENLPIFMQDHQEETKDEVEPNGPKQGQIDPNEIAGDAKKGPENQKHAPVSTEANIIDSVEKEQTVKTDEPVREPTDEEVKERLNKLLKGEL